MAAALDIHPFMLSKWRKQVRDGVLRGRGRDLTVPPLREIRRLQALERAHALLQEEHELLKKAIRFCAARRRTASRSSRRSGAAYALTRLCALYGVTPGGHYAWRRRPESAHAAQDRHLEFFTYNAALPFHAESLGTTEDQGFVREQLRLVSTPGVTVSAHLYRPSPGSGGRGGVILLHGGSANGKSSPNSVRLAQLMARDGWTVLAIDLLHYGERASGLFHRATTDEFAERLYNQPATYLEFVTQTVKDVRRSVDYLVQVRGVDARRIVLAGVSRGAVLATIAGAVETRLAAVILLQGGHMMRQERGHQAAACPANYVQRVSPRPLLTINTEQDALFLADAAIRPLLRLARPPVQVRWTNGPHGYLSPEDLAAILEWLGSLER